MRMLTLEYLPGINTSLDGFNLIFSDDVFKTVELAGMLTVKKSSTRILNNLYFESYHNPLLMRQKVD